MIERIAVLAAERGFDSLSIPGAMTLDAPIVLSRPAGLIDRTGLPSGVLSVWGAQATLALIEASCSGRPTVGASSAWAR